MAESIEERAREFLDADYQPYTQDLVDILANFARPLIAETRAETKEECALVADACSRGVAVEINEEIHILGALARRGTDSQRVTATTIAAAIRALPDKEG